MRGAIRAAASQTPPLSADLGAGLRVSREAGSAVVRQTGDADAAPFFSLLINKCGTYTIGGMLVSVSESDAGFVFSVRGGST